MWLFYSICYTSLVRSLQSVRLEGWEVSSVLAVLAEEENHPPTRKKRPYPGDEASSSSTTGVNEVVQFFGKDRRLFKKQRTERMFTVEYITLTTVCSTCNIGPS